MKYALCISGQPRFFEECGSRLMEFINSNNLDCDIFAHAWSTLDKYQGSSWTVDHQPYTDLRNRLISMYSPKKIFVEDQKDSWFKTQTKRIRKNTGAEPYITASMFYSIHQAAQLRRQYSQETGIKYDAVIRARFDYYLVEGNDHFIEPIDDRTVYFVDVINNKLVVCDYWMIGSEFVMRKVENSYFHMFKKNSLFKKKLPICGEEVITDLINHNGLCHKGLNVLGGLMRDSHKTNQRFGKWQ